MKCGKWKGKDDGGDEYSDGDVNSNEQAGLNLNLFAALSGAFSSATQKTTHKNADGSSTITEQNHSKGIPSPSPLPFSLPFTHLPLLPTFPIHFTHYTRFPNLHRKMADMYCVVRRSQRSSPGPGKRIRSWQRFAARDQGERKGC